jgi:pimeloyl-ACP methyl ester carboxylesterase
VPSSTGDRASTVVLVHGAWHGSWCFDRVLPVMHAAGVDVRALDLAGDGFASDVASVRDALDAVDGDVVLLGHSYGGAVITEAGVHPAVRHLVYLCAFALDDGEACTRAATDEAAAVSISHEGRPSLGAAMIYHDDGTSTLTRDGARACLYHDVDDDTFDWAYAHLGPQRSDTLGAVPRAIAWRTTPSTYVVCTEDQGVHPDLQRIMACRCGDTVEWPLGHSPFANRPDLVGELLVNIARRSG